MRPTEHGPPACFVMPSLKAASQAGPERPRSLEGSGRRAGGPGCATAAGPPLCTPPFKKPESEREEESESESDTRGTRDSRVSTAHLSRVTAGVMSRVTDVASSRVSGG